MSSEQRWRIHVDDLETQIRVGIYEHEKKPQRVMVNVVVDGIYSLQPKSIEDCFNYEVIYKRVTQEWPKLPHTPLLESYVVDLLAHIFEADSRVEYARVRLGKLDVFVEARSAGVEAEWTRVDFEKA